MSDAPGDRKRAGEGTPERSPEGLCPVCRHVQVVSSATSRFLLCRRSRHEKSYPKYPPQPVMACAGWER